MSTHWPRRLAPLLGLVPLGCAPEPAEDSGPAPSLSIGQGAVAFTPLEEDSVEVVFGPQGGWHIEPAVRAWGLPVDGLVLSYDLLDAAGASRVIAVEAKLSEDRVVPLAEGGWERVGDRLVLEVTSAEELVGERLTLSVRAAPVGEAPVEVALEVTLVDEVE